MIKHLQQLNIGCSANSHRVTRIAKARAAALTVMVASGSVSMPSLAQAAKTTEVKRVSYAPLDKKTRADYLGRSLFIVDLVENEIDTPEKFESTKSAVDWQTKRSTDTITAALKSVDSSVIPISITSLSGTSFSAYLSQQQAEKFVKSKDVALVTEDRQMGVSSLWSDTQYPANQTRSWGLAAMNNTDPSPSNGTATVYVLDTGVDTYHSDLPNVSLRINGNAVSNGVVQPSLVNNYRNNGCWGHATHVAGIIGATDNADGVVGMLPGVNIVSVAAGGENYRILPFTGQYSPDFSQPTIGDCVGGAFDFVNQEALIGSLSLNGLSNGLDYIFKQVLNSEKVAVVNISANHVVNPNTSNQYAASATLGSRIKRLATPRWIKAQGGNTGFLYKGVLVVQSAGNTNIEACFASYDEPHPGDGIIVVGGINADGAAVTPSNGGFTFSVQGTPFYADGSNHGSCVEMWAPATAIKSTWTANVTQVVSGTSMAAPHISGFAAKIIEGSGGSGGGSGALMEMTSTDLEYAIRQKLVHLGGVVYMPRF